MLTDDHIWSAIDGQRGRVADLLESLTDEQWQHPSLCEGWTVRDVGAHLTLQQMTLARAVRLVLRNPSHALDVNRIIHESSRRQAAACPRRPSSRRSVPPSDSDATTSA